MGVTFEAWTMPTTDHYRRVLTLEPVDGTGSVILSGYSDTTLAVPATIGDPNPDHPDGLSDLDVIMTAAPWVRCLVDGEPVEFRVTRARTPLDRPAVTLLSGPDRNGAVEGLGVYPFDWPAQPTLQTDWVWGGRNTLPDPTFENPRVEPRISEFWHDATEGHWVINAGGDTINVAFDVTDPNALETLIQSMPYVNDVLVEGHGAEDDPFRVQWVDPAIPVGYSVDSGTLDEPIHAVLIQHGAVLPAGFDTSQTLQRGVTIHFGEYETFEVATPPTPPPCGGQAVHIVGTVDRPNSYPGIQRAQSVTPGGLYQAGAWVYPEIPVTLDLRLVIRHITEEPLIGSSQWPTLTLPADEWSQLPAPDITMPNADATVIWRLAAIEPVGTDVDFWVACPYLNEGQAPATPGQIVRQLVEAAQTRGTFEFLDIASFDDDADSADNPWPEQISFTAFADQDLGHVLDALHDIKDEESAGEGYEWDIRPKPVPEGGFAPGAKTHDLMLWIPGAAGTAIDEWDGPAPSVAVGSAGAVEVVRRTPDATVKLGHGTEGLYRELVDNDLATAYGRWEGMVDAEELASPQSLLGRLRAEFARQESNTEALSAVVSADDSSVPLVHYRPGDEIWWVTADQTTVPRLSKPVRRVDWTYGDRLEFTVQGSRVLTPDAAQAEGMVKFLRWFSRRQRSETGGVVIGGGGGMAHILVVSTSEPDFVQAKADYVVPEEDSSSHLQAIFDGFAGGTIWMAGRFRLESDVTVASSGVRVRGLGYTSPPGPIVVPF